MRHANGFTLIEAMIVVVIAAILAALAAPSFRSTIAAQRITSVSGTLQSSLNLTRAEALKSNANVTLAPNSGTAWNTGWKSYGADNVVISTSSATPLVTITGPASVVYQRSGRASAPATFKVSAADTTTIRCVTVSTSGSAMVTSSGC